MRNAAACLCMTGHDPHVALSPGPRLQLPEERAFISGSMAPWFLLRWRAASFHMARIGVEWPRRWPLKGRQRWGRRLLPPAQLGAHAMPIRSYLDDHAAFAPDEIDVMSRALEETCKALHIDGRAKDREIIAARIVDLARNGLVDATALRDRVLAETKALRSL